MKPGPRTREQLQRLSQSWAQGEHLLLSGSTGSGKTSLIRPIIQIRIDRGGYVIVFVTKIKPDRTIVEDYKGFSRWQSWKKRPRAGENAVLLWPDLSGMAATKAKEVQKEIFKEAYDGVSEVGRWTVVTDEGLYVCNPAFLNLADELAMSHAVGRSSGITNVVATQRPSHIPLVIYGSASHAMVGRTRLAADLKRLQELGGRESTRELQDRIAGLQRREFLWLPVAPDWPGEVVDLSK